MAAGLISTSQGAGGALGVAIAASIAFARVPSLTRWAGHNQARIAQARADVFHEAFIIGAGFALLGVLGVLIAADDAAPPEMTQPRPANAAGVDDRPGRW